MVLVTQVTAFTVDIGRTATSSTTASTATWTIDEYIASIGKRLAKENGMTSAIAIMHTTSGSTGRNIGRMSAADMVASAPAAMPNGIPRSHRGPSTRVAETDQDIVERNRVGEDVRFSWLPPQILTVQGTRPERSSRSEPFFGYHICGIGRRPPGGYSQNTAYRDESDFAISHNECQDRTMAGRMDADRRRA